MKSMPISASESRTTLLIRIMFPHVLTMAVRHIVRQFTSANLTVTFRTRRRRRRILLFRRRHWRCLVIGTLVIVEKRRFGVGVSSTTRRRSAQTGFCGVRDDFRPLVATGVRPAAAQVAVVFGSAFC